MKKVIWRLTAVLLSLFSLASNAASELQNYVQQCETELQFNAGDVSALNCNNGIRFAFGGQSPVNDFFIYQRVNDIVDLAVACRWLASNNEAASVELLINNRQNGSTCFFSAKDTIVDPNNDNAHVSASIVSPTNFNPIHSSTNPNADDFWLQPTDLNNKRLVSDSTVVGSDSARCVGCHSQGPYIANALREPDGSISGIAPLLAQFGLLNNGHPTFIDMTAPQHYHAVGASGYNKPVIPAFQNWDSIIANNNVQTDCSGACHSLAVNSIIGNLTIANGNQTTVLPSIQSDIISLVNFGLMPPNTDDSSVYRWINLDTPTNSTPSNGVETENFADAMSSTAKAVPNVALATPPPSYSCPAHAVPGAMEAHAVGVPSDYAFTTGNMSQIPDRLRTFNLKEGLVCINSDQELGQSCHDYAIRYLCSVDNTDQSSATWSGWYNTDSPSGDGDHEERSRDQNICGGVTPIAIQAQVSVNGVATNIMGPNDRLARFSAYGLTCNNTDQVDGQCSNYVVRYDTCTPPPNQYAAHVTNVWSNMQLTATSNANSANVMGQPYTASWNTQQWSIEPVTNTEYVRLHDTGTNTYLNVTTQSSGASAVTYALNTSWLSEEWIIEPIAGSNAVRLKNLWSGTYLTIANTSNYAPIYAQSLNTSWISQAWVIK